MKTNVGIETTDEQRKLLAQALGKKGMVSRNDIKEAIDAYIKLLLTDAYATATRLEQEPEVNVSEDLRRQAAEREPGEGFTPSRGDEPYIFKAKDPQLHQLHSNLLDALEALENYTWADMEANRT